MIKNAIWPSSIRDINELEDDQKQAIYAHLIPEWVFADYGIDPETHTRNGHRVIHFHCPKGSRAMEISIQRDATEQDPMLYLNMADTFQNQLLVLLVVVNDMDSERYNIDVDQAGNLTQLGTESRNIPAELAAMRAGLAPGQIRVGMRAFKQSVPIFETFVSNMGHDLFLIEPLAYHNAIVFERYGFNYIRGLQDMRRIHTEFQPGGNLYQQLDDENPFRQVRYAKSIRGRSWAIHDGILGYPYTGFQMYKRIGINAGVNTFPDAIW
ncbi:hypothetical protein G4Y79_16035 [Phototrophicus methaneseepsis]|uniref:Uncharacterized protein n=1 Tax=Phototrophicus methaneseepsis TaxID=2710758 RepID=A0A7S8ID60_9CHLR|nr:hypothetical protein [Phototrophicus methaneseepsis]QPC81211.1 hypothetical protein G4Y79_16035 [Phototrophicus methaneseepsis]